VTSATGSRLLVFMRRREICDRIATIEAASRRTGKVVTVAPDEACREKMWSSPIAAFGHAGL